MSGDLANLEALSTRKGFNSAVRHIKKTISVMEDVGSGVNVADLLFNDEEISGGGAG